MRLTDPAPRRQQALTVFRGEVDDIALGGNVFREFRRVEPLRRVAGTDFYFRSLSLPSGGRFEYTFNEFDEDFPDPRNPHKLDDPPRSIVTMPGWTEPHHLRQPPGDRGRLDGFQFASEILGNQREVQVYLPPGYEMGDERYPLWIAHVGGGASSRGKMNNSLDTD